MCPVPSVPAASLHGLANLAGRRAMLGEGRGRRVVGIRRSATGRRDEGDDDRTRGPVGRVTVDRIEWRGGTADRLAALDA